MTITLILSDLHLGAYNSRRDLLSQLLESSFDRLVLNGDTVNSLNFERFRRADWHIVERLQAVARERELVLIRGNHDGRILHPDDHGTWNALADLLGTEIREEYEVAVTGGRYLVLHGDQFDRTLNMTSVGDAADWFYGKVQRISRPTARWLKERVKHVGGVVTSVKQGATLRAQARGCTGVITGHTHYADDERCDGFHYLNTGCWVDSPCSYVRIENGHAQLEQWPEVSGQWSVVSGQGPGTDRHVLAAGH
jgi:UDP-2,3-diacylglucosamine pyrophosphatase LpxH